MRQLGSVQEDPDGMEYGKESAQEEKGTETPVQNQNLEPER
jgi:hypothetical protein